MRELFPFFFGWVLPNDNYILLLLYVGCVFRSLCNNIKTTAHTPKKKKKKKQSNIPFHLLYVPKTNSMMHHIIIFNKIRVYFCAQKPSNIILIKFNIKIVIFDYFLFYFVVLYFVCIILGVFVCFFGRNVFLCIP